MSGGLRRAAAVLLTVASLIVIPVYSAVWAQEPQTQGQAQTPAPGNLQGQTESQAAGTTQEPPPEPPAPLGQRARDLRLTMGPDFSIGPRWFPNVTSPYRPMNYAQPLLTNSPRIDQLIQNGKLELSLQDAISLSLENNLAIAVERYTPWIDEADLLLSKSGVNGRLAFDPTLTGQLAIEKSDAAINNPFLAGVGSGSGSGAGVAPGLVSHTGIGNFTYAQGFHTGTQLQVTFNNTRSSVNLGADLFNPFVQSSMTVQLTQPLLNGFGRIPNTRFIIEAKNTVKVGESQFAQQVMATVAQTATDYWELVYAREFVKVEQTTVAADQQLYENNKKQLEIGTMAPLDVITAESQLASDQQALVQAQTTQLLDETTLLVAITKDPLAANVTGVEIDPTTPIVTPDVVENISLQEAVNEAWRQRPELQQAGLNLENAGVEVRATKNLLLPTVDLFGLYTTAGVSGVYSTTVTTPTGTFAVSPDGIFAPGAATGGVVPVGAAPIALLGTPVDASVATRHVNGLLDDYDQLFHNNYPTYEAGVNITLPVRNRFAQAQNAIASLTQRQQEGNYQQTKSTIVLNVRQTLIALLQDRAAVKAAAEARVLAQESYDDEVKKLQLGTSTAFTVVQKQQILTAAQGTEVRDRVNLIEAEVNFNQAMGRTLDVNNILVSDVLTGQGTSTPNIPGTALPNTSQPK